MRSQNQTKCNYQDKRPFQRMYDARDADEWAATMTFFEMRRGYSMVSSPCVNRKKKLFDSHYDAIMKAAWSHIWGFHRKEKLSHLLRKLGATDKTSCCTTLYPLTAQEERIFELVLQKEPIKRLRGQALVGKVINLLN